MTIREYIELHITLFGLANDKKTFNKIKTKVSRTLNEIDGWYELDSKVQVGKTTAFVLDDDIYEKLDREMRPYFLKLAKIRAQEFEQTQKRLQLQYQNLNSEYELSTEPDKDPYLSEIPREEKLYLMIEALFEDKFELDEEAWKNDLTTQQLFFDDPDYHANTSLVMSAVRLRKPREYYVKKRESE
ncbi:TPA: hypothetical protein ACGO35_000046 [Streptococcus suis]